MSESAFVDGTFTAPRARRARLSAAVLEQVSAHARLRLLDLGCGTGAQLLHLAEHLPAAELVGIDTSAVNIAAAAARIDDASHGHRLRFLTADYLDFDTEPFDVIVADSVLQNIAVPDSLLFAKLARDLRPRGLLIVTLPFACGYNHVLWGLRRVIRLLRGPLLERSALALARKLHPDWDRAMLEERIPYLYMIPARIDDAAMVDTLARDFALVREQVRVLPHASLAQPKHRLSVFRKDSGT